MLDHIRIHVHNYERSRGFYQQALMPLGYGLVMEFDDWAGFGWADKPELWIRGGTSTTPQLHIAFRAEERQVVRDFYRLALEAGGKEDGPPGVYEQFHPDYYAAIVLDPDGHKLEVVCHLPADLQD
ncbi:VOC family protein [Microbulbifer sp. OS29]|uniref:VOC family protein n=1 Tax=Microbulbifer okhotskensis TaxID=2926617 RepID=A0A9X2J441_9GAMM|nr:VOC family protein [Microbulbifer okhotskensis]MCO1334137.1 VOC family protein [Microbulbifer okhotskensis]